MDKLRVQAAEQAETVAAQEKELTSKKEQLEGLKQEEQRLEQQRMDNTRKLENLTTNLQDTQLSISQVIKKPMCDISFINEICNAFSTMMNNSFMI